jgi:V/A-type H+-transporting ATPase subunit K
MKAGAGSISLSGRDSGVRVKKQERFQEVSMEKALIGLAAALAVAIPAIATAWAQSKIGSAGAGALAEKPELSGTFIILVAIPETMVLLGFVVAYLIIS